MNYLVFICSLFFGYTITAKNASTENTNTNKLPDFEIFTSQNQAIILYNKNKSKLDSITAHLLAEDIFKVTNYKPEVITNINQAKGNVIVIGTINSKLIASFINKKNIKTGFENQWESYLFKTVLNPNKKIKKAFIIAGTNPRGTAYGVFSISKKIGVSPWYWWADVPVKQSKKLILNQTDYYSNAPSVAYRGIFLNDEDWGLQPWAAKTLEPETGDIGPKTYSKIFELLLRLNANTIWPAMHPSTKAFFHYPGNAKMASLYNIVIGSSHAEPMLRNNVDEWDKNKFGSFNYKTNKDNVYNYWETRVKESKNIDAIYTIGMRGVHDSGMEGVKNNNEAVAVLDEVITDQRQLLKTYINKKVEKIPQAFTVYKEVLDLYKNGLKVPEDITLVWTDDNYGYIRALSNTEEQKRAGGAGVYYHISYWGRPHDYLWLDSTNPFLIQEEMMKAYNLNNRKIWIVNVGDIKPAEYNTQLFLDMAYDTEAFQNPEYIIQHQHQFYGDIFGDEFAENITKIKDVYFQLAFERKPEFMGWSQTEPTTQIFNTAYNPFGNGDEIQQRIDAFNTIENQVKTIDTQLPEHLKSTFTQLVSYPVEASSAMNKKFLYRDKALSYAKQGRLSASTYKELSNKAYENIMSLTENYNQLSNGKWQGIMDMKPRKLPVYDNPSIALEESASKDIIGISVEDTLTTSNGTFRLPTFYVGDTSPYFIDLFLKNSNAANWQISKLPIWIKVTKTSGVFDISKSLLEDRIYVSMDWSAWKASGEPNSESIKIQLNSEVKNIQINISNSYKNITENSFIEKNGMAVIYANHFSKIENKDDLNWEKLDGLGHSKSVMQAFPLHAKPVINHKNAPALYYEIFTETITNNAQLTLVAIPTHPTTTDGELRVAVQWNDEPIQIINFKTEGRSNTWKQNVLSNKAKIQIQVPIHEEGKQVLKIYMVDPSVLLDYYVLNTTSNSSIPYKLMPETKINTLKD
ncbi:glycosyl hydrolase 115 family protein [Mariniflexile sp. HNIBRBA6329]|uniref:glycosyl hydrolase 115 family protein n=1 Tax=Mariniflexile sp. HNIBRBA6329 TaxID=3373088 RepID=UPI0037456541